MSKDTNHFVIGKATVKLEAGDGAVFEFECSNFTIEEKVDIYRSSSGFPQIEDMEVVLNREFHFEGTTHEIDVAYEKNSPPQNINSLGMLKRICKREEDKP